MLADIPPAIVSCAVTGKMANISRAGNIIGQQDMDPRTFVLLIGKDDVQQSGEPVKLRSFTSMNIQYNWRGFDVKFNRVSGHFYMQLIVEPSRTGPILFAAYEGECK